MRAEGYIKSNVARACASMGLNPYALGFESGTIGSDKATREMMMNRVRSIQVELANNLEMFLINELLWEGGFDPYNNPADVVKLTFTEIDVDMTIKLQNHAADLFNKEALTHKELRQHVDKDDKAPITDFKTHMLGKVESGFERQLKVDQAKAKKSAGRPSKEFISNFIEEMTNKETSDQISDYISQVVQENGLSLSDQDVLESVAGSLLEDPLALQELFEQLNDENI
jgi:hypothetical protein